MPATWLNPVQENIFYARINKKLETHRWEPVTEENPIKNVSYWNNDLPPARARLSWDEHADWWSRKRFDRRTATDKGPYLPDVRARIHEQESKKRVPLTTSMNYGKRSPYDAGLNEFFHEAHMARLRGRRGAVPAFEKEPIPEELKLCPETKLNPRSL